MSAGAANNYFAHPLLRAHNWQHRPQLDDVCNWWRNGGRGVCALIGMGGAGKTAVAERFLRILPGGLPEDPQIAKDGSLPTPHSVFVFSFYDAPNTEAFFYALQMWLQNTAEVQTVWNIGQFIFQLQRTPGLIVVDGLERVQEDGQRGEFGRLSSPKLRDFLDQLAAGNVPDLRVIVTSRFPLSDLRDRRPEFFHRIPVDKIDVTTGMALLRDRGVKGTDPQLRPIVKYCGQHALTVDFAGGYIAEFGNGDPATALNLGTPAELEAAEQEELDDDRREVLRQGFRFARIAGHYRDAMIEKDEAAMVLLERICLFRLGVDSETLAAIFTGEQAAVVSGKALAGLNAQQLQSRLDWLTRMQIVEVSSSTLRVEQEDSALDSESQATLQYSIHPAVRDGFLSGIGRDAAVAGHEAVRKGLEVSLGKAPGEYPSDPATLDLLEEIVHHTLQSGHIQEAWDFYWNRIGVIRNLIWRLGAYERGERICRAFGGGQSPETIRVWVAVVESTGQQGVGGSAVTARPQPHITELSHNDQGAFINSWALILTGLGRLAAAAQCYELAIEIAMRQEEWKNASVGNYNLCDVWLLSGRLSEAALATAAEALRLAELAANAESRQNASAHRGAARAILGEISSSIADFRAALEWQHKDEHDTERPLYSNRGYWHTHLLARLGRCGEAMRLTEANQQIATEHNFHKDIPQCQLVLSSLSVEHSRSSSSADLWTKARDWGLARDAKQVLCWSYLVEARHALAEYQHVAPASEAETAASSDAPSDSETYSLALRAGMAAIKSGLKIARDCGYGLYHIDLLLTRARLYLLEANAPKALDDIRIALDDGIPADDTTGQPQLLAARAPECGYAWAIPEGLQLCAEAVLLQAAQQIGSESLPKESGVFFGSPAYEVDTTTSEKDSRPPQADIAPVIDQARQLFNEALDLWQPLHDPEPERDDQNFQLNGKQYNYKAAATHRVLSDLKDGILTRHPLQAVGPDEQPDVMPIKANSDQPTRPKMRTELNDAEKVSLKLEVGGNQTERIADVIFIHGLGGGSQSTWAHDGKPECFWPDWIAEEFSNLGIWTLGYKSSPSAWHKYSLPLARLGSTILDAMLNVDLGGRPIIFITHSLGGLVAKEVISHGLTQGVDDWKTIANQVKGVSFLATPHSGASLANFAKFLGIVLKAGPQVDDLEQHSGRLRNLHDGFKATAKDNGIICQAFAENEPVRPGLKVPFFKVKVPTGISIVVVDQTSADLGITGTKTIVLEENHISICKPENKDAHVYSSVRRFLRNCIDSIQNPQ